MITFYLFVWTSGCTGRIVAECKSIFKAEEFLAAATFNGAAITADTGRPYVVCSRLLISLGNQARFAGDDVTARDVDNCLYTFKEAELLAELAKAEDDESSYDGED